MRQGGLDLVGGSAMIPDRHSLGELGTDAALPPGPYLVGLTKIEGIGGDWYEGLPYVVRCSTGQAIVGQIPSREIAQAIADALNAARPAP